MYPHGIDTQTYVEVIMSWRIVVAAALGTLLGLERSLAGKHAGMRTYALVSLGSCLFVVAGTLASFQLADFSGVNPLGIAANVVVGVGFIGAGLAVFRGEHPVELTTATGLWVSAGIGMAVGFGFYIIGLASTIVGLIVFSLLLRVENAARRKYGTGRD